MTGFVSAKLLQYVEHKSALLTSAAHLQGASCTFWAFLDPGSGKEIYTGTASCRVRHAASNASCHHGSTASCCVRHVMAQHADSAAVLLTTLAASPRCVACIKLMRKTSKGNTTAVAAWCSRHKINKRRADMLH
jgi:hypothetical protein